ncbi:transposase, partial [Thiolapillus sp.]
YQPSLRSPWLAAGEEGWCVGLELRPGDQHSQKDFPFFLDRVLPRARQLAGDRKLLVTLDGAHDAAANREQLSKEQVDYLIKWNPRGESPEAWKERAETEGRFEEVRPGKQVALFDELIEWIFDGRTHQGRRVVRLIERTEDRQGQPLLFPELTVEGWWTSLDAGTVDAQALITLYQQRGTSEQYHSEFKTDLDLASVSSTS